MDDLKIMKMWPNSQKNASWQHELCAHTHRNLITPFVHNFNSRKGRKIDNGWCCQALGATQLPITLMEVLHPVMPLLAPFMENIMSLSAWPLRQNEGERKVRLAAKWSREMRIPSGWQTPGRLFEKVSFVLIWLFWGVAGGGLQGVVCFFSPIIWLFIKFNCGSATLHPSAKYAVLLNAYHSYTPCVF